MLKKLILPILLTAVLGSMIGCNSSTDDEITYIESSSVAVASFSLSNDSKVLDSLSNVFFSIDLIGKRIFNADSLPYGTKTSRLIPVISVASGASEVNITYYCPEAKKDSVVNYLTNSTDSIDFSHGPVKLTVKSQSGLVTADYEIRVNVHQVKADSLAWYSIASAPLPTSFKKLHAQHTAMLNGTYYCLTTDGSDYCLATTTNPLDPQWQTSEVTFDFTPKVESLRESDDALYILDDKGLMYKSTDCRTWASTGLTWHYIYGGYGKEIIGCAKQADKYTINTYPTRKSWELPADFPVEGTSQTATYTTSMAYAPQMVMIGGRTANGTLTRYAWGFDGNDWIEISKTPLPIALEYVTLVPYQLVDVPQSSWKPMAYPVLLAFGGRNVQGSINRTVYYSRDWGMTWRKAPDLVQLPNNLPTIYGSSAFEYTSTMSRSSASASWTELPLRALPPQYSIMLPGADSRAVAPITQWECPAIYLFGGRNYNNEVSNTVWRGVITQFTFKPVQ